MNPFKFGTIVENDFFTDRISELEEVKHKLDKQECMIFRHLEHHVCYKRHIEVNKKCPPSNA